MTGQIVNVYRNVLIVGIFTALMFGCKGDSPSYRTDPVTRGDIQQAVTATGTVNAVTTVQVGTQVSGTIKTLYVDFNSRVKKGAAHRPDRSLNLRVPGAAGAGESALGPGEP